MCVSASTFGSMRKAGRKDGTDETTTATMPTVNREADAACNRTGDSPATVGEGAVTPPPVAEKILPLLREAATAQIKARDLIAEAELLIAGDNAAEFERWAAEMVLERWVESWGPGESAAGLELADVNSILEEIVEEQVAEHRRETEQDEEPF